MSSWISLRNDREFWTPVPPKTMRVPADQPWPFSPALTAPLCERLHITTARRLMVPLSQATSPLGAWQLAKPHTHAESSIHHTQLSNVYMLHNRLCSGAHDNTAVDVASVGVAPLLLTCSVEVRH